MFQRTFETDRLRFRPPSVDDAEAVFEKWASQPEATRFMLWPTHESRETTRTFLETCTAAWGESAGRFPWVLKHKQDDSVVGMLELNRDDHTVELGYVIARHAWGNGYATEAARAALERSLEAADIWRVFATDDVDNRASIRVLEKIGMTHEGTIRRYAFRPNLPDEGPRDAELYAQVC